MPPFFILRKSTGARIPQLRVIKTQLPLLTFHWRDGKS